MKKVAIVVDSTMDLSDELRNSVFVVPLKVELAGEIFKDGERNIEGILQTMKEKNIFAKTSQPSPIDFEIVYKQALENHDFVVSIHISEKLSGTIGSARIAAQKFENRIFIFDTNAATIVADEYVRKVLEMKGAFPEEIIGELRKLRNNMKLYLTVGNLEFLKRSGRLKGIEAMIGSILKLRPVIEVHEGALRTRKITRGDRGPLRFMKEAIERAKGKIIVGHIMAPEKSRQLMDFAASLGKPVREVSVRSAALSVHLGPGSYGVAIFEDNSD